MVNLEEGKKKMEEVVKRFSDLQNSFPLKEKSLSEQDITTKFVLQMFSALNWNLYRIDPELGPEVHEKAFKEKEDVSKGLPDVCLSSKYGTIFVEVKKPPLKLQGKSNLDRYEDADLIVLTSFEELAIYCRYRKNKPVICRGPFHYTEYLKNFDEIWNILSNTEKGKNTRGAYRATRKLR
jgi:hypothetical protein